LPDTVVCFKAAVFRLLSEELFELLDGRTARDVFKRGRTRACRLSSRCSLG